MSKAGFLVISCAALTAFVTGAPIAQPNDNSVEARITVPTMPAPTPGVIVPGDSAEAVRYDPI